MPFLLASIFLLAKDDAEVQKLSGSLQAAETALIDLDDMVDTASRWSRCKS